MTLRTRWRSRCLALALTLVALLLAGLAMAADARAEGLRIKVLSYNIDSLSGGEGRGEAWQDLLRILKAEKPDLVVLQEAPAKDFPFIAQTTGLRHYQAVEAYGSKDYGPRVGMFSRWPMKVRAIVMPATEGGPPRSFGLAELDVEGVPVAFYGLHLSRQGLVDRKLVGLAREFLGQGRRQEEMEAVVKQLRQDPHRFKILAGDLNTYPESGPYRLLSDQLRDAFPPGAPGTYRMDKLKQGDRSKLGRDALDKLPNPKIDHIMASQALRALDARVIQQGSSDHFPVVAIFTLDMGDQLLSPQRVQSAQTALARLGFAPGPANGRLDAATRRAVAAFQARKGLAVDGMLNKETLQQLAP